jgi:hypothetical protein
MFSVMHVQLMVHGQQNINTNGTTVLSIDIDYESSLRS